MKGELDALAQKLNADENLRVQLLAYASGTDDEASQARRISLSRALAVRSYLIKQGVRSTRMDVRALGNNVKDSPQDRVDIISRAQ
jgi:outer membrane protein OmpA-like peptidoglycan-associated protein